MTAAPTRADVERAMSPTQKMVLRELAHHTLFPGYCEIMLQTGLKSFKAVDWVLDALERRGMVTRDSYGDYIATESGLRALNTRSAT
jgi:hypothetical protein